MDVELVLRESEASEDDDQVTLFGGSIGRRHRSCFKGSQLRVILVSATLIVALVCLSPIVTTSSKDSQDVDTIQLEVREGCHTAVLGEPCWEDVDWAQNIGIREHPDWYSAPCASLRRDSSFEEFQACVYKTHHTSCKLPCNLDGSTMSLAMLNFGGNKTKKEKAELEKHTKSGDETQEDDHAHKLKAINAKAKAKPTCHTAVKGHKCYHSVAYAMQQGIRTHPEWYPGLNVTSTFEEFQTHQHTNHKSACPVPCPCHTAQENDECYKAVKSVLTKGIKSHPSRYKGLTIRSRFEDIQIRLHEDRKTTCPIPCTPRPWGSPSLFCFSVFRSQGYEHDLAKAQYHKRVGIFGCDDFAVLSDAKLPMGDGVDTLKIPPCEEVGRSKDGTAANTMVFMQAWAMVLKDLHWRAHDWIIKADPDAVLLPDRLRNHLRPHTGKNVFMRNCMKRTGPGWPMMFGSLEAFSYRAVETYLAGGSRCKTQLPWWQWGEDLFMGNCLQMLGVQSEYDGSLIGDKYCAPSQCWDGRAAAYHPFKTWDSWLQCYNQAMR